MNQNQVFNMRYSIFLLLLVTIAVQSYCQSSLMHTIEKANVTVDSVKVDSIVKINFFYLPWDVRGVYSSFSESDVRDLNGRTSFYSIEDSNRIYEFTNTLNITNLEVSDNLSLRKSYHFPVQMVIDIIYESDSVSTVLIDNSGNVFYQNTFYFTNLFFKVKLLETVPPAERKWWE